MPSNWEGFGYAAVEAMAAEKAVIATHVSSLPEIIEDGKTGLLVPPRAPKLLADAMIALVDNPRLRSSMGKAGARKAEIAFSLSSMISGVESVLLDAAGIPRDGVREAHAVRPATSVWRLLYHWLL
jgi:glycosyltransferase involved in cell wall biosynthesis